MTTPAPVEIARKVLEGVEYFGAEKILARAVIELSAENDKMHAAGWFLRSRVEHRNHGTTHYEGCEGEHPDCAAMDAWDAVSPYSNAQARALAALSPTEGDGRKEQT